MHIENLTLVYKYICGLYLSKCFYVLQLEVNTHFLNMAFTGLFKVSKVCSEI